MELPDRRIALPDRALTEYRIASGSTVSREALIEAVGKYQRPAARNDTGRFLQKSEHTAHQLNAYLLSRGYEPDIADEVTAWACEYGLVDDRRYGEIFIRSHTDRSPMGVRRIRKELSARGISCGLIDELLVQRDDEELFEGLVTAVRKKYGSLDRETAWRRASGWLARRGFGSSMIYRILSKATDGL